MTRLWAEVYRQVGGHRPIALRPDDDMKLGKLIKQSVMVLLFQFILWRATLKALMNGGIDWRGTHYPLQNLKSNRV